MTLHQGGISFRLLDEKKFNPETFSALLNKGVTFHMKLAILMLRD